MRRRFAQRPWQMAPFAVPGGQAILRGGIFSAFFVFAGLCMGWRLRAFGYDSGFFGWETWFARLFALSCPISLILWGSAGKASWGVCAFVLIWQGCICACQSRGAAAAFCAAAFLCGFWFLSVRVLAYRQEIRRPARDMRAWITAGHFRAGALCAVVLLCTVWILTEIF